MTETYSYMNHECNYYTHTHTHTHTHTKFPLAWFRIKFSKINAMFYTGNEKVITFVYKNTNSLLYWLWNFETVVCVCVCVCERVRESVSNYYGWHHVEIHIFRTLLLRDSNTGGWYRTCFNPGAIYLSLPPTRHDLTQGQKPEGRLKWG